MPQTILLLFVVREQMVEKKYLQVLRHTHNALLSMAVDAKDTKIHTQTHKLKIITHS